MGKPTYVKPSFYAHCFLPLKEKAKEYGYNLVLHGSMNRDFDLIALPWDNYLKKPEEMILAFAEIVGGTVMEQTEEQINCFPHGRKSYVINIDRGGKHNNYADPEWYLDISLFPGQPKCAMCDKNIDHGEQVCLDCFGITEDLTEKDA